jgi:hypothetical protein
MRNGEQIEIAGAAFAKLEALHTEFIDHVAGLENLEVNCGSIKTAGGELMAECLGVKLRTIHRPVVKDGNLRAIEYAFKATQDGEELDVFVLYLEPDENLYADSKRSDLICQARNIYLAKHLIERMASALLSSKIFVPKR